MYVYLPKIFKEAYLVFHLLFIFKEFSAIDAVYPFFLFLLTTYVHTYLFCVEQSKEIPWWNSDIHCCVHGSLPLNFIMSQINPVPILMPHLC